MLKLLLLFFLSFQLIFALDLKPNQIIKMSGGVIDMEIVNHKMYVGTDSGDMAVYDIRNSKIIETITLKKIHDFMGDLISAKIYSVDAINDKKLLLAEGENGAKNLFISNNKGLKKIIGAKDNLSMNKARFIDKSHIFIGLLSNEILLYDINKREIIYKEQLSQSKFSDFALNEDKSRAVIACESGINYIVNTKTGKVIKKLKGANKDNVFKVAFKNGKVSTAGQDRIGALYDTETGGFTKYRAPFLVYSTGLSSDAKLVAYAINDNSDIEIYDTINNQKLYRLRGQRSTLNTILFYDNKTIFSSSDDKYIMKWKLK